jgi:Luciferase-like monooxygenase
MDTIKMGIGFGLWQQGMPDAHTLFEYIDKAEAWGIDSVWLSDHMMGERAEVSIVPMMAAIAARTQRLKFGPSVMMLPLRHPIAVARAVGTPAECRDVLQRFVEHGLTKFALWPACLPSQLIRQLEFYARDIIPYFEARDVPVAAS